jgi:hypothetical protein
MRWPAVPGGCLRNASAQVIFRSCLAGLCQRLVDVTHGRMRASSSESSTEDSRTRRVTSLPRKTPGPAE